MHLPRQALRALLLCGVLAAGCGRTAGSRNDVVHYSTTSSVPPLRSVPATEGSSSFFLHAVDQNSDGAAVTVEKVVLTDSRGWVVVHADDNGGPGLVLGISAQLPAGTTTDVTVPLRMPLEETSLVHPMLHLEDNNTLTCEFPAGDAPVRLDGSLVLSSITVAVGG
ncbi:MAG: DUF7282 domain-containing protein [Micromonosporaceae bacterium]